jgi:hypothetical protein
MSERPQSRRDEMFIDHWPEKLRQLRRSEMFVLLCDTNDISLRPELRYFCTIDL